MSRDGRPDKWAEELREVHRNGGYYGQRTLNQKKYPRGKLQCGHEFAALQWDWHLSKFRCVQCKEAKEAL